ncbi:relaxase/mobilization nuclease domain-containing protein [Sphingopyxis indica]|uniref:relaxase/mobilization nuclease domain-containing protein n=1 Tax=Sphingopyxis indica TaxID=436663 RepID=UPI002938DF1A|nr:relaxase/mobilization nuclease domain-containing protein [Sphingopyxis indica]
MSDFDNSFEAHQLALLFRPRPKGDPNIRLSAGLARATGRKAVRGTTARLARVVSRAPEVMVKVTGRPKGSQHLAAHLDYIGRRGGIVLENRDGDYLDERDERHELARHWSDPMYRRNASSVAAVGMIFSMPAGTEPGKVLAAVREVAKSEIAQEWDYVMALHTDTPRPHVHLTVAARGDTGRRFNPRPHTLHRYRERFAEELRARGVTAEATPRAARGVGRAGHSMALHRMRERLKAGTAIPPRANQRFRAAVIADYKSEAPPPRFVSASKKLWAETSRVYLAAADQLAQSTDAADRQLADKVRDFVKRGRMPTAHEQAITAIERAAIRDRSPSEREQQPGPPGRSR